MQNAIMKFLAIVLATFCLSANARAQEHIAIAIEGWSTEARADGVVYYRCASNICAAGSVVSYKAQPHRTTVTLADFEKHHRGLAEQNAGRGRIRAVRIAAVRERTIDGVRVMQVSREVDWDDKTTFTIEARLIGPDRSFSLVSDSPKPEWTENNFEGFLRSIVPTAGAKAP